jgi:hypothetical protein
VLDGAVRVLAGWISGHRALVAAVVVVLVVTVVGAAQVTRRRRDRVSA